MSRSAGGLPLCGGPQVQRGADVLGPEVERHVPRGETELGPVFSRLLAEVAGPVVGVAERSTDGVGGQARQ
ncbi:hypothetical protein [Streptomyces cacaoi]|uniref:hypothetical protein n=1 Tax=Streptomyces cacaoi TaxID=1898 RepID=UPI0011F33AA8|nr:hypothetical protein [Streptomyces cacaoi]